MNTPYIEKKYRPIFDQAVNYAIDGWITVSVDTIIFGVKSHGDKFDGCLNYVFTQLFRKTESPLAFTVIEQTIIKMFLEEPSYHKIERIIGLLNCMLIEFETRNWMTEEISIRLDALIKYMKTEYKIYERKKCEEEGDLE